MQATKEQMDKMMTGMMTAMSDANKMMQDSMSAVLQNPRRS